MFGHKALSSTAAAYHEIVVVELGSEILDSFLFGISVSIRDTRCHAA